MHHWSIVDCTYLYDGSIEGLLCSLYRCIRNKEVPMRVVAERAYKQDLFDQRVCIETDLDIAEQTLKEVTRKGTSTSLYYMYTAFLAGDEDKGKAIVYYLVYVMKYGSKVNFMKSCECVIEIQRLSKSVLFEVHRMYGFLRFKELKNHYLYAEYTSDHNILEYLAQHFAKRLSSEIWMIHDVKRQQVALYYQKHYHIVDAKEMDISKMEGSEDEYLQLWKEYFQNISIKERENKRCQRSFMPKKYWQYLPEVEKESR